MYMYVYMYIYIYYLFSYQLLLYCLHIWCSLCYMRAYRYVCAHVYIYIYIYIYMCVCVCACACACVRVCVCACVCVPVCLRNCPSVLLRLYLGVLVHISQRLTPVQISSHKRFCADHTTILQLAHTGHANLNPTEPYYHWPHLRLRLVCASGHREAVLPCSSHRLAQVSQYPRLQPL